MKKVKVKNVSSGPRGISFGHSSINEIKPGEEVSVPDYVAYELHRSDYFRILKSKARLFEVMDDQGSPFDVSKPEPWNVPVKELKKEIKPKPEKTPKEEKTEKADKKEDK